MDAAQFRGMLPEFSDPIKFPEGSVVFWINYASKTKNAERWGDLLDEGIAFHVAHELTLATRKDKSGGVVTSKTVDKVSITRDANIAAVENGGAWNETTYGKRYLMMARMIGAGGLQL